MTTERYIFLDTETSGLKAEEDRIIQLSYIVAGSNFEIIEGKNFYMNIDERISDGAVAVHKIDNERLLELSQGKTFKDYAKDILWDFQNSKVIGHNVDFDKGFLKEEFKRIGRTLEFGTDFCTMWNYTTVLKIEHSYYGYKWPKLEEVVRYLKLDMEELKLGAKSVFGEVGEFHDARLDVYTVLEIYKKLKDDVIKQYLDVMKEMIKLIEDDIHSYGALGRIQGDVRELIDLENNIARLEGKKQSNKHHDFSCQSIDDDDIPF